MSSPFQKRPQLSKTCKTYGSRRTSGQGTSNPSTRQQKSILLDSSDEAQSDTTTLNDQAAATQPVRSNGAESVGKGRTRQVERQVESEKPTAAVKTVRAYGRTVAENVSTRVPARPSSGRRTRSSTLPAEFEQEGTRSGESSTVWDEEAALQKRPEPQARARKRGADAASTAATTNGANSPKRSFPSLHLVPSPALNASTQSHSAKRPSPPSSPLTDLSSDADVDPYRHIEPSSPPARKKRARLSAVAASPVATKSISVGEGNSRRQAKKQEVEEDVPPPFEYVPLTERVAKASPSKPRISGAPTTIASEKTSRAPPQLAAATELIKPVPHRPYRRPAPAPSASAAAVPTAAVPPKVTNSMAMSRPRPPPSPAKDLSSLFTKFSAASTSTAPAPQARVSLKRSASLVEASSGMVGRMKSGRRATADERTLEQLQEEEERSEGWRSRASLPSSQTTPPLDFLLSIASASPVRRSVAMDRSLSQPVFPSSPLGSTSGSPRRSPCRPALNTANSLPFFGDRERAGSPSPSPSRPTIQRGPSSSIFPSYGGPAAGSAYRPVAFSGPPAGLLAAAGVNAGGPSRTYAAGRTVKRDEGEEALLAGGRPPHPSHPRGGLTAALSSSPHPSTTLPGLPPLLRRPLLAAPRPPRETYASLRSKWGIDAEEDLDDQEEEESQGRGARVEGGGVLKKRGEGKRWGDEVGFMLEGLVAAGSGDEGAGRSSALEILSKLHDRDWLRRLKASGLAEIVYTAFRRGGAGEGKDKVLDIALLLLLALLLRDQRLSEPLFRLSPADIARPTPSQLNSPAPSSRPSSPAMSRHNSQSQPPLDSQSSFPSFSSSPRKRAVEERDDRCDLMEVMKVLAEVEWTREEIGKGKEEGEAVVGRKGGKKDRGDARYVQSLRDFIDLSDLFVDERDLPITALNLLLLVTRSISSYTPRTIFQPQQLLCWSGALESIVWEGIVHEASNVAGRMEKYEKGLDLLPPSTSVGPLSGALAAPSLPTLQLSLQILEAVSAVTPFALPSISTPTLLPSLAKALSKLTLFIFLVALDAPSSSPALSEDGTQVLALKTLVAILGALYGLTTGVEWAAALLETSSSSEPVTKGAKPPAATATAHVSRGELVLTLVRIVLAARRRSQECRPPPSLQVEAQASDTEMPDRDEEDREEEASGPEQHLWDILSLSLGVLANLVDCVGDEEGMKDLLRTLDLNPACRARRKCSRFCVCPQDERQTLIVALVQLAAQDSMEDAPNTVYQTSTLGFLRLTLGLSILSNPRNESLVLSTFLPSSTSDTVNKIAPLSAVLDALEDLAKIQEQQRQAQGLLLGGPREDEAAAVTQSGVEEEMELDRVQEVEEEDRSKRIRETVARLRRGVYERGK